MASPDKTKDSKSNPLFPVGPAGKRELKRALVRSTDPAGTITKFQQTHNLHSMMARALDTTPRHEQQQDNVESLDTDSVMAFLSQLGVRQHEVHKRISDTFLKQLEDEIRKTQSEEPLLKLLQSSWAYATTIPELRPVVWAVLKQLGAKTPLAVLQALGERDKQGNLKNEPIFKPLPSLLKRLVWEADWDGRMQGDASDTSSHQAYLDRVQSTLLYHTIQPLVHEYETNRMLVNNANRPFVATARERRLVTTQRRALTSSTTTTTTPTSSTGTSVLRTPASPSKSLLTSGKAVSQLRNLLSDTVGTASSYRPKLLYALLSILMAQHGANDETGFLGASRLCCTLVADILLSAGGSLPKGYQHVHTLARILDEVVQEGNLDDERLIKIQASLRQIFQSDGGGTVTTTPQKVKASSQEQQPDAPTSAVKRQLNRIISAGLTAMKDADPQNLFLNPVTDAIAPGYSKIISKPMCIIRMEQKVARNEYTSVTDWETDVKQVFKNCIDYNRGNAGQWFRGEAHRQSKVFREEIFPQARRLYQTEIAKRSVQGDGASRKRGAEKMSVQVSPLPASSNKRQKKDHQEYLPSMPALASMLLSDPFVVRIVLARILRELRRNVLGGSSLPVAQSVVPSLLQLLHMSKWSSQICAVRGKKYFVPDAGLEAPEDAAATDPIALAPYETLRRYSPLLLRLLMEAELDQRVTLGGDLHAAAQVDPTTPQPLDNKSWSHDCPTEVPVSLIEGSLVHVCQPGNVSETSLPVTYPKFASALQYLSDSLEDERAFFLCLIQALLKHKVKLSKSTRDAVVQSWLSWLRREDRGPSDVGTMTSSAHEYLILLLNEWTALGNQILPRDTLLEFATDVVEAVNASEKKKERQFSHIYHSDNADFAPIRKRYERMLKQLSATHAKQWREQVGIDKPPTQKTTNKEAHQDPSQQDTPMEQAAS